VGAVALDAKPVHRLDALDPEWREADVLEVGGTAAEGVGLVENRMHETDAGLEEGLDPGRIALEGIAALQVKPHREKAPALGRLDLRDTVDEQKPPRIRPDVRLGPGDSLQRLAGTVPVSRRVHRDEGDARRVESFEQGYPVPNLGFPGDHHVAHQCVGIIEWHQERMCDIVHHRKP
jgi:hypothetical protein